MALPGPLANMKRIMLQKPQDKNTRFGALKIKSHGTLDVTRHEGHPGRPLPSSFDRRRIHLI